MRSPSRRRRFLGLAAAAAIAPVVTACLFLPFAVAPLEAGFFLLSLIFIAVMALLMGFLGALAFLAPALLAAERVGEPPWSFVAAGLLAGLAHTAVGVAVADPETRTTTWQALAGFLLTDLEAGDPASLPALYGAAAIGGIVAGWVYSVVLRGASRA